MGKKKVLIVDDEQGFTRLLKMNLESTDDYDVEARNEGSGALEAARRFRPDLILLDVVLPDMSGREIAAALAGDPDLKNIPIVYLTATVSRESPVEHQGFINGDKCLAKPASLDEIIAAIEESLQPAADG